MKGGSATSTGYLTHGCGLKRARWSAATPTASRRRPTTVRIAQLSDSWAHGAKPGPYDAAVSFYRQVAEDRFDATDFTRGPWDPDSQHAGPPAALLSRAIERRPGARDDMRAARLTFDIVRPVPVAPVSVTTKVARSGRSVEVVEAELSPDGGPAVMRLTALLIRAADAAAPAVSDGIRPPGPETGSVQPFFPVPNRDGYHTGMETRFTSGGFMISGPATCWFRMRVPLVDEETPSPLTRLLIAADSGNGVSNVLGGVSTCSSTSTCRCTCTGIRSASGCAWTPRRRSTPMESAWPTPPCSTRAARSAVARRACSSPPGRSGY